MTARPLTWRRYPALHASPCLTEDSSRARLFHVLSSTGPGGPLDAYQILLRLLHRNDWFTQVGAGQWGRGGCCR